MPRSFPSLALLVLGCSAPLEPVDLCDTAESLVGQTVEVRGHIGYTLTGHGGVACDDGSCCNPATFAPAIECDEGPDIVLVPADDWDESTDPFECEGDIDNAPLVDGMPPSASCPTPQCRGYPWRTALGTIEASAPDPVTGEPMLRLVVDSFTVPTR